MNGAKIVKAIITTDGRTLIAQPDGTYRKEKRGTDRTALDAVTEAESEDMAELGIDPNWIDHATVVVPFTKERITVRLDRGVIAWLKAPGRGQQTRIDAILRAYVEMQKGRR